jgi:hypothetical protein
MYMRKVHILSISTVRNALEWPVPELKITERLSATTEPCPEGPSCARSRDRVRSEVKM